MSDTPATTAPVVFESVELSRRLDAIWAAWRAGIFTDDERETRSAPLRELLHQTAADEYGAVVAAVGGDASLLAVGTWVVVAGELIESAWGNQVRADLLALDVAKLNLAGGTMTGLLNAGIAGVQLPATEPTAVLAVRRDWVETLVSGSVAGKVNRSGDTMTGLLVVGAIPESTGPTAGAAMNATGGVVSVVPASASISTPNVTIGRGGSPGANAGAQYVRFDRAGAVIGSITIASATSVAYNTTSDKRIKTLTRPVDPDEAVARLAGAEPVNFVFTAHPEDGEQVGFFAQDLITWFPEAVTPGHGEPGDDDFVPWMIDVSKLVPPVVAAIQALTRRIEALENAS